MFEAMNREIERSRLHPAIDREFSFEAALDAYRYLESGVHVGKVAISVGQ